MPVVMIYTDGSCCGNPGKGGYCAIIRQKHQSKIITGSEPISTNNRIELKAVISGLSAVESGAFVTVFTDSAYIERAINDGRLAVWQQNGWRRIRTGEPVQNAALWTELVALIHRRELSVRFIKVRAHKTNYFNNLADALAKEAAKSQLKERRKTTGTLAL